MLQTAISLCRGRSRWGATLVRRPGPPTRSSSSFLCLCLSELFESEEGHGGGESQGAAAGATTVVESRLCGRWRAEQGHRCRAGQRIITGGGGDTKDRVRVGGRCWKE
jgi:hypothetical protein